ncbi:MAG TPA: DUF2079 domain-containing protein [Polyangia bacterium]|jgi:uncharacterized membrane protein|nr:DUF2079 domain-containing protein [Polyangia bacterium]
MTVAATQTPAAPPPPLTRAARALGLLGIEGASVALAVWFVAERGRLPVFIYNNLLPAGARKLAIAAIFAGAILAAGWGAGMWIARRAAGLDAVERASRRLAPLCLAAFAPLLLHWQLWTGPRELTFAVLAAGFGLSLQALMRVSLAAPPLLPAHLRARIDAARADLAAWLASVPWLPTAIVVVAVLRHAIFFSNLTIRNHFAMQTAGYDLGIENNLVWNAAHWNGPLFKTSVQWGGPAGTHIGLHQTYISYLIGIPYRLLPRPETLLVLQSVLIGAAALPLYAYARRHLGAWTACFIALLCLFYAPLHGSNLYDFHYLPFAPFFLWTTLALLDARRDRWAAVAIVLTLANREDMSALLVVVGLFLLLTGDRPRAGVVVAAIGAVYFVVVKFIVMPRFLGGATAYVHQYKDLVPAGEHGFAGVLETVLGNPGYTATTVLHKDKALYLLQIMAPLAFFPWRRPIGLLCSVPGFFFTMLATQYPWLTRLGFQYTAYWTSFLFLAVVANLRWLNQVEHAAPDPAGAAQVRSSRRAWKVAMAVATLVTCYQLGPVFQQHTSWAGFLPLHVDLNDSDRLRHANLEALIDQIPPDASVAASEMLVAQVSSRKNAYTLLHGHYDADYILARSSPAPTDRDNLIAALRSGNYGLVAEKGVFVLFRRGAPSDTVQAYLRQFGALPELPIK